MGWDGTIDLEATVQCPPGTPLKFGAMERTYDPAGNMVDTYSPVLRYAAP